MTAKTKKKSQKIEINIMGSKYKVDEEVNKTLQALSEALHSHEVALLTWIHKDYNNNEINDLEGFRKALYEYCLNIPEAENILKRMVELDDQANKDLKENKVNKKNKSKKDQGAN